MDKLLTLKLSIDAWQGTPGAFAKIIADSLGILGMYQRELATEFEVSESTISRWASGISCPHPKIQALVLSSLKKRVARIAKSPVKSQEILPPAAQVSDSSVVSTPSHPRRVMPQAARPVAAWASAGVLLKR